MEKVLFICVHNSARSQMAEAYLRELGSDIFEVESAGFDPTEINPLVVEVMKEEGMDLSNKATQSVFDLYKQGRIYSYVITVCEESDGQCPIFPGMVHRLHIPFVDPAAVEGTREEKLEQIRTIRDEIKKNIQMFVDGEKSGKHSLLELYGK